jgi:hypothetical protein
MTVPALVGGTPKFLADNLRLIVVVVVAILFGTVIGKWFAGCGAPEPTGVPYDSSSIHRASDLPPETKRVIEEKEPEKQGILSGFLNPLRPLGQLRGTVFTITAESLSMSAKYYNRYLIAALETSDNGLMVTSYNPSQNRIMTQLVAQPNWWRQIEIRTSSAAPSISATSARPFHFDGLEILTGRRLIPDPLTYVGAQAQVTFYDKISARLRLISEPAANIELGYHL